MYAIFPNEGTGVVVKLLADVSMYVFSSDSFLWEYSYSFKVTDKLIIADYLDERTTSFDIHHI